MAPANQLEFRLGRLPAGSQAVETSERAGDSLGPEYLGRLRRSVLAFIVSRGERGATADEIAIAFECGHNTTSPRVTELDALGYLERCDGKDGRPRIKRATRSGRSATVFRANDRGRAELLEERGS